MWTDKYSTAMESSSVNRQEILSNSKQSYPHLSSAVGAASKLTNSGAAQFVDISDIISAFVQGSEGEKMDTL